MAQINDIVNELNTIATAFTSVETFIFDEIGAINEDRLKSYPAILVDSRNIDINPVNFSRSNMPSKVNYTFKIFFLDTYPVSEQKTTTRQTKYAEVETIANQYLAEVKRRCEAYSTLKFTLLTRQVNNGFVVDQVHNDNLVQLVYSVTFEAWGECVQGTFSDMAAPPSEDVTININDAEFTTAMPFSEVDIYVQYENGTQVGSSVGGIWTIPNPSATLDSSVYINSTYFDNVTYDSSYNVVVKNAAGTAVGSKIGSEWIVPTATSDIVLKFYFQAGDDVSAVETIDSFTAGTYTAIADDGSSGTITLDINSGGFGSFVNPTTFVATDTIQVQRTTTTGAGYVTLTGTY